MAPRGSSQRAPKDKRKERLHNSDAHINSRTRKRSKAANKRAKAASQLGFHSQAVESESSSSDEEEDLEQTHQYLTYEINGSLYVRKHDVATFKKGNTRSMVYAEDHCWKEGGR